MASQATRSDLMEAFKAILFTRYYRDWAHDEAHLDRFVQARDFDLSRSKGDYLRGHECQVMQCAWEAIGRRGKVTRAKIKALPR